ncbi:MAG: hypothetical protein J6A21_02500 [Lentisphaeria bacterium]|nr:hypothetical protein [Lentisphaeria bacterium]
MKNPAVAVPVSFVFFLLAAAGQEHTFSMEKNGEFRATFQRDFSKTSFVPGGVSGRCFKAVLPEGGKIYAVHSALKQKAEDVNELDFSGFFKGKGSFRIGFILYGEDGKIFWLPAPGVYSPVMKIDSETWEKRSFVLRPEEKHARRITGFLTAVVLLPGTELCMDEIHTKIVKRERKE